MFDVPDYKLDPPDFHREECSCDECHDEHLSEGCAYWIDFCRRCRQEHEYHHWLDTEYVKRLQRPS